MPLGLRCLKLNNFRSYRTFALTNDGHVCIIVGPNAVGKTNVIEAIQLMTGIESFRTGRWAELVRWGEQGCRIQADIAGDGRDLELVMTVEGNKRSYRLNGKGQRPNQLRGLLPVVLFTPDDLRLVKDDAGRRRGALDEVGCQLSSTYAQLKADYEKAVKQRNHLLKADALDIGLIDSWTASLIIIGSRFYQHRRNLFEQLRSHFARIYTALVPGEHADLAYLPSWKRSSAGGDGEADNNGSDLGLEQIRDLMQARMDALRPREYERRITLIGPHRDEILFLIGGRDARKYASQGQQRTLVLAWKLAEVAVIEAIGKQPPILLLDDVMSELDADRRRALLDYTNDRLQTFVTTTTLDYFDQSTLDAAQVVHLARKEVG